MHYFKRSRDTNQASEANTENQLDISKNFSKYSLVTKNLKTELNVHTG